MKPILVSDHFEIIGRRVKSVMAQSPYLTCVQGGR
jgi:hypothetical protein